MHRPAPAVHRNFTNTKDFPKNGFVFEKTHENQRPPTRCATRDRARLPCGGFVFASHQESPPRTTRCATHQAASRHSQETKGASRILASFLQLGEYQPGTTTCATHTADPRRLQPASCR